MMKSCHHRNTQQHVCSPCFQQYGEYQGKKSNWNSGNSDNQASDLSNSNWNSNKSSWSAGNENRNSNWSSGDPGNKDSNWGKKINQNSRSGDSNQNTQQIDPFAKCCILEFEHCFHNWYCSRNASQNRNI